MTIKKPTKTTRALPKAAENMRADKKGSGLPIEDRKRIKDLEKKVEQLTKEVAKIKKNN